jgi:uncharacterized protein
MNTILIEEEIEEFCQRHHITKLMLFGSVLRGEETTKSDIDILITFAPEYIPGFLKFSFIQRELSTLFGRKVDLSTANSLSRYFRQQILETAEVIYEKKRLKMTKFVYNTS